MKIGIFDSGLGGLFTLKGIIQKLPQYDYLYLGDTLRLPYGERTQKEIYEFTKQAVNYLFKNDCALIIIACNTASAKALKKIQKEFVKVLGVIIPTIEVVTENKQVKKVGIIATSSTVQSKAYTKELKKINPLIKAYQRAAPTLVPLIESNQIHNIEPIINMYLTPLLKKNIDSLILGCTHYSLIKDKIKKLVNNNVQIVSQDEFIADKLMNYLKRHSEISEKLSQNHMREFCVTLKSPAFEKKAKEWFGEEINLKLVKLT